MSVSKRFWQVLFWMLFVVTIAHFATSVTSISATVVT